MDISEGIYENDNRKFTRGTLNTALIFGGAIKGGKSGVPAGEEAAAAAMKEPNSVVKSVPADNPHAGNPSQKGASATNNTSINVSDQFYNTLGESQITDGKNNLVGTVSNTGGVLDLYIRTKETQYSGRGNEVFKALVKSAEAKGEVSGINGTWSRGSMGSNLRAFNDAINRGLTPDYLRPT